MAVGASVTAASGTGETASGMVVRGVRKAFGGLLALDDVSFSVAGGEIVALVGPNGAGKTTLLDIASGFIRSDSGEVCIREATVSGRGPVKVAQWGVRRTFQVPRVFEGMSVSANVELAFESGAREGLLFGLNPFNAYSSKRLREAAQPVLERIGLATKVDEFAAALSHGQRRLLDIARAMVGSPAVLLLDEPSVGVAPSLLLEVQSALRRAASGGAALLIVEHNMRVVRAIADRVVVLHEGRVLAQGTADDVLSREVVLRAYFGEEGARV